MMHQFAFVFPGQGSQISGMGKALAEEYPVAAEIFSVADEILGFSLSTLCFEGPSEKLNETANTQPALLVTSLAAFYSAKTAIKHLPFANFMAGHSLGEYSALVAAGALSFADGVRLVRRRGELMSAADASRPGGMAAILALTADVVDAICAQARAETSSIVQVANYNSPGQVVISGEEAGLEKAIELAKANGARRSVRLPISIAAHSPLMAPAAEEMAHAIQSTEILPPTIPVISNINARPMTTPAEIRQELIAQMTAGVQWEKSVRWMGDSGVDSFVEFGPGNVLAGLIKRILPEVNTFSVGDSSNIEDLQERVR